MKNIDLDSLVISVGVLTAMIDERYSKSDYNSEEANAFTLARREIYTLMCAEACKEVTYERN